MRFIIIVFFVPIGILPYEHRNRKIVMVTTSCLEAPRASGCDDAVVLTTSPSPCMIVHCPALHVYNGHCPVGSAVPEDWPLADTQSHLGIRLYMRTVPECAGTPYTAHQDQGKHRLATRICLNKLLGARVWCVHIVIIGHPLYHIYGNELNGALCDNDW